MCEWYCRYGYVYYKHHGSSSPDAHLSDAIWYTCNN